MIAYLKSLAGIINGANKKSQFFFLLDGIVINCAYLLTTGIVLSGYAIMLGANDFTTAILNNCTNFATILSLLSFVFFENRPRRKKLLLTMNVISRFLIVLIALLPLFFHNNRVNITLLVVIVIISELIWSIYRVGWIVWMMSLVPKESKSDYIYFRTFATRLFMSIVFIASGFVLDMFNKSYIGFLIIFAFSFALSLLDVWILNKVEEIEYEVSTEVKPSLNTFLKPVLNNEYRNFLIFNFLFYLAFTMATSFTPIYLIRYLNLDYKFISTINVISQTIMIISNMYWVRIEKGKGYRKAIGLSAFFTASELLILSFVTKETWPLLFLSSIIAGIGAGGFGTATFTYRYEIMPEAGRTIYEGWYYFAFGLSMLAAPFLGNFAINQFPVINNIIFANSKMQLLYLMCFALLCLLLFFIFIRPFAKRNISENV